MNSTTCYSTNWRQNLMKSPGNRSAQIILWLILVVSTVGSSTAAQYEGPLEGRQGTYGVVLKAGPVFPVGEFSDLFGPGFGGYVEVPYHLGEEFQVFVGLGGLFWNVDNDKVNQQFAAAGGIGTVNLDAPYRMIPLSVGFNYFLNRGRLRPYLTLAFSLYFQKLEASGTVTVGDVTTPLDPLTDSWSQGAFAVGAGAEYELSRSWALVLDARYGAVIDYEARVLIGTGGGDVVTRAIRFFSVMGGVSYTIR